VAAILSAVIAVDVELLTTVRASEIIDSLPLYLVEMTVPPFVSALVTAEAFFLPLGNLLNLTPAVLAGGCLACERYGRFGRRVPIDIVPSAKRLHRVQRYAKRLGNLAVTVARGAEFDDLRFLIVGHNPSAPSEGCVL